MQWLAHDGMLYQASEPWDSYILEEIERCPAGSGGGEPCPWLALVWDGESASWQMQHGLRRALEWNREERFDAMVQHGPKEDTFAIAQAVLDQRAKNERGGVTTWQDALGAALLLFLQERHAAIRALNGGQPWGGRAS